MCSLDKCDVQFEYTTTSLLVFFTEQEIPHPEHLQKIQITCIYMYTCIHCICKVPPNLFVLEFIMCVCLFSFFSKSDSHYWDLSSSAGTYKLTKGWLFGGVMLRGQGAFRPHWGTWSGRALWTGNSHRIGAIGRAGSPGCGRRR